MNNKINFQTARKGIQFVMDEQGNKTAVQIDLTLYSELWEDFYDSLIVKARAGDPRESLAMVKERLIQQGKLDG